MRPPGTSRLRGTPEDAASPALFPHTLAYVAPTVQTGHTGWIILEQPHGTPCQLPDIGLQTARIALPFPTLREFEHLVFAESGCRDMLDVAARSSLIWHRRVHMTDRK